MSVHTKRPMTGIRDGISHMDSPEPSLNVAHGLDRAIPGRRMTSRVHTLGDPHVAWPTGQLQRPYKVGRPADHPHAAIRNPQPFHGHPGPSWPPRCLAIRARPTPHPGPSLPAAPRITPSHLANWSIPFASTHATRRGHRTPACLALVVSAGRSAAPALQVRRRRVAGHPACKRSVVRK
jgi:hypothetical protein